MNPDEPLRTKNLAEEEPAPMDDTLGGYPWLPRMIDKARAAQAGALGDYFRYPCPIDRECLSQLSLDADSFARAAMADTPGQVLAELRALGIPPAGRVNFDPVALNRQLHDAAS